MRRAGRHNDRLSRSGARLVTVEDAVKLAVALAGIAGAFGLGDMHGTTGTTAQGWCGEALAQQAQHFARLLDERSEDDGR